MKVAFSFLGFWKPMWIRKIFSPSLKNPLYKLSLLCDPPNVPLKLQARGSRSYGANCNHRKREIEEVRSAFSECVPYSLITLQWFCSRVCMGIGTYEHEKLDLCPKLRLHLNLDEGSSRNYITSETVLPEKNDNHPMTLPSLWKVLVVPPGTAGPYWG